MGVATVVYDGDCGFCMACVAAAQRRLRVPVAVVPWQSAPLDGLGVPADDARRAVQWIEPDGTRMQGHLAVAAWLRAAGPGWRLLGALLAAPPVSPCAAAVYRLLAANRRRIPGPWPRTCSARRDARPYDRRRAGRTSRGDAQAAGRWARGRSRSSAETSRSRSDSSL